MSKRQYRQITGREQESDIIAYQIRQSFKPGEVTPEQANEIGYELAMRFLKGKHAFLVCTHVDKKHIHSHIIFNSTSLDCTQKFRDFLVQKTLPCPHLHGVSFPPCRRGDPLHKICINLWYTIPAHNRVTTIGGIPNGKLQRNLTAAP